eukprot:jgi/Botrbrau1/2074/Bobra.0047s0036.2
MGLSSCCHKKAFGLCGYVIIALGLHVAAHPPLLTDQQPAGGDARGADRNPDIPIAGQINWADGRGSAQNVIRNATERAARLLPGAARDRVIQGEETSFPGIPTQDGQLILSQSQHSTGYKAFPVFSPPSPFPSDLRVTLGLPQLPDLFGEGGGGGGGARTGDGAASQALPPALADIPDPSKGPVTVIPGLLQVTTPSGQDTHTPAPNSWHPSVDSFQAVAPAPVLPPIIPTPAPATSAAALRAVPTEAPRLAPTASPVGLGMMVAPIHSTLGAMPLPTPSLAPPVEGASASMDVYLGLRGEGLLPFDDAKKNATVVAVANILKVAPSHIHFVQVSPQRRRQLLDLSQAVEVKLQVEGATEAPPSVLQERLMSGAADGKLLEELRKAGLSATAADIHSRGQGVAVSPPTIPAGTPSSKLMIPIIAGAAGGGLLLLLLIFVITWWRYRARRRPQHPAAQAGDMAIIPMSAEATEPLEPIFKSNSASKTDLTEKTPPTAKAREFKIEVDATFASSCSFQGVQETLIQATPEARGNWVSALSGSLSRSPRRSSPRSPIRQRSMSPTRVPSSLIAADAIVMNVKGTSMVSLCSHALQVDSETEASPSPGLHETGPCSSGGRRPHQTSARIQNTINLLRTFAGELSTPGSDTNSPSCPTEGGAMLDATQPLFLSPTGNLDAPNRISAANSQLAAFSASLSPSNAGKTIQQLLIRLNANRKRLADPGATGSQVCLVHAAMEYLTATSNFAGKYVVDGAVFDGASCIVATGKQIKTDANVQLKFFVDSHAFSHEKSFYSFARRQGFMPGLLDVIEAGDAPLAAGVANPACVVTQRGDYTLTEWLNRMERNPSQLAQKGMLCNLLEAVAYLHTRNLVHRDIRPANVSWFDSSTRWRVSVPCAWAKRASDAPITYTLRYAAPEVVTADAMGVAMRLKMNKGKKLAEMGETFYVVDSATDMWAVGAVAWELFTGRPLFGENFADEQVAAMLLGFRPLPFESDPSLWVLFRDAKAAQLVQGLLVRQPDKRLTAAQALQEAAALSGAPTNLSPVPLRTNSGAGRRLMTAPKS